MRRSLISGVGVAAALMMTVGVGTAVAINEYKGQTYGQAAQQISSYGGVAVIATREGSYLPTDQCIVVGSRSASFLDSSGRSSGGKVLLDINCNDTSALNGHPGNSVATPEGKKALQVRDTAKSLNDDYANSIAENYESYCAKNAANCKSFCETTGAGLCSDELMEFLGA